MSFTEPVFLFLFLPFSLLGYYLIRKELKTLFLLIASVAFYTVSDYNMLWLLITIIVANYLLALLIEAMREHIVLKKIALFFILLVNFGILYYYKYLLFTVDNINALFHTSITLQSIALPVGISFITFRSVSYCVDVYWGTCTAERNPLNVGLYIAFFPQVTMGPITKFSEFQPQLHERIFSMENLEDGAKRIILGLVKKLILANQLGVVVDKIFLMQDSDRTVLAAWIGIIGYLLQLYYDFAGYSDIAIGLGKLFGFQTPENFNYPYASKSVADFWARWHMTLGAWLKDYIYVPVFRMCNSRELPLLRRKISFQAADYIALFAVWTFSGLWHGAAWNFILFGYYYCFFIILEHIRDNRAKARRKRLKLKKQPETKSQAVWSHICTFIVIIFGQLLFRVEHASDFIPYVGSMFGAVGKGLYDPFSLLVMNDCLLLMTIGMILAFRWEKIKDIFNTYVVLNRIKSILEVISYIGLLLFSCGYMLTSSYNPFLYGQF